jgi:hypothetical protein
MALRIASFLAFLCILPGAGMAENIAPMALNSVGAVPPKIQGAPLEEAHGAVVGRVAKIETDVEGKPLRADVTLTGGRMVFLDPASLSYDEAANILVTALNQQQLAQLGQEPRG